MTITESGRRLPDGFVARIRSDLLRNTGEQMVGGSPLRALRLSQDALAYVSGDSLTVVDETSSVVAARLLDGNLAYPEPCGPVIDKADLTVVIPVRDRPMQLDRCLAALAPLATIVVDDASRDQPAVARVAAGRGAKLLPLAVNRGPAHARNQGLAKVTTPYVAFVDSDVEVDASALLELARHFDDRKVALVGPVVVGTPRSDRPRWFERYDAAASSLDLGRLGSNVRPGAQVAWLPSACLVGRVTELRAVSGFDERMRVGEDVDLVWRLVRAGSVVRYDPTSTARHDTRNTLRGWLSRKFVYGTGGAALAERHGDWTAPAVLSVTVGVGAGACLAFNRWSLPIALGALVVSSRALRRELPDARRNGVPLDVDVAIRGLGWAVVQESALLLRHWWPLSACACLFSRTARRMVTLALVVDTAVATGQRPEAGPISSLVCRRLDDLAYGAGLWTGALRAGSWRCLSVRRARELRR